MSEEAAVVHGIVRETGDHACGAPSGLGTDERNPAMTITCPDCRSACWLCLHPSGIPSNCDLCGCLAHYPKVSSQLDRSETRGGSDE